MFEGLVVLKLALREVSQILDKAKETDRVMNRINEIGGLQEFLSTVHVVLRFFAVHPVVTMDNGPSILLETSTVCAHPITSLQHRCQNCKISREIRTIADNSSTHSGWVFA